MMRIAHAIAMSLLLLSGSCVHTPPPSPDEELVTLTLDEVSALDVSRMGTRITNLGLGLAPGSLSREELEQITITGAFEGESWPEVLEKAFDSVNLQCEWSHGHLQAITRKE